MRKLYDYYRSSASYRVRIALNLKQLSYEKIHVNLVKDGGQQFLPEYKKMNPQSLVPAYVDADANTNWNCITQSIAIIEFIEEMYPEPFLLPKNLVEKSWVRAFAQIIACDIHPLNNLRVLKYLTEELKISEEQKTTWYKNWLTEGFNALESLLVNHAGKGLFCHGNAPTLADICLVPQVYNAIRYNFDLTSYPTLMKIYKHCESLPAFIEAYPKEPLQ